MARRTFLTGRETELKVGVKGYETKTSLEVTGRVGIGTTLATADLEVQGDARFNREVRDFNGNMGSQRQVLVSTGTSVRWDDAFDPTALKGITVQEEGITVGGAGSITTLNFVGDNVTADGFSGIATVTVDPFEPSGENLQVQFNDNGTFAGAQELIYNEALNRVSIGRTDTGPYTLTIDGNAGINSDFYGTRFFVTDRTPTQVDELASKEYVDLFATAAIVIQQAVAVASTENLTANYYEGGVAGIGNSLRGVGAALSATVNGALSIDGYDVLEQDRVLIKNQNLAEHNGYYVAISTGSASTPWILQRAGDFDEYEEIITGAFSFVTNGEINGANGFVLIKIEPPFDTSGSAYIGVSSLTFTQFSAPGQVNAGLGLYKEENTINVGTANSSRIVVNPNDIDLAPVVTTIGSTTTRYDEVVVKVSTDGFGRVTGITSAGYVYASPTVAGVTALSQYVFDTETQVGFATLASTIYGNNAIMSGIVTAQSFSGNFENTGGTGSIDINYINAGIITAQQYFGDGSQLTNILSGVGLATETAYIGSGATTLEFRGAAVAKVELFEPLGIGTITIEGGRNIDDVGNANQVLYKDANNNATTSANLTFNGTNLVCGGTVTANSDESLKENVKSIEGSLEKITQLRGVEFDYKETGDHSIGLIAQEVEEVLPDLVYESEEGIKSVAYQNIVAVLIEAVKEQQEQINALRGEIRMLKGI